MSFLSAAFLLGLATVAVPIILHLIHRQRYPDRRFTTLRFFDVTIKHNVIQKRLIDRLLLALRILMLMALMLALARPFWKFRAGDRSLSVVLVLDNSPSMARAQGGRPVFERARDMAAEILGQLKPGDKAALLLSAPSPEPVFTTDRSVIEGQLRGREGRPTGLMAKGEQGAKLVLPYLATNVAAVRDAMRKTPASVPVALIGPGLAPALGLRPDIGEIRSQLAQTCLSDVGGNLDSAVARAATLLDGASDVDRVAIVISDMQKADWPSQAPVKLGGAKLLMLSVPPDASPAVNLGLEECLVAARGVHFGQGVVCAARVHNYGQAPSPGSPSLLVELAGQRQPLKLSVPVIAPGTSAWVPFVVPASARGRTLFCTATIENPSDPFPYDNRWHFQIPVMPPLRVLCVNAANTPEPAARSGFFLVNALAPRGAGAVTEVFADVEECAVEDLKARELFQYNVLLLAGVEALDKAVREKLRAFIEDGGGVLVFPGAKAAPEEYNGWGFLPARVLEARAGESLFVKSLSEEDAFMADVAGRLAGGERGLSAESWIRLEPDTDARVLAELSNGSPALVAGRQGKGRVVLCAAGGHVAAGSNWPLRPAFVILLRGLVQHLAAADLGASLAPARGIEEGLATAIPGEMAGGTPGSFVLALNAGTPAYTPLAWFRRGYRLLLPPPERPGHYVLSIQPTAEPGGLAQPGLGANVTPMAVNHVRRESVFTPLSAAEIKQLCPGARVETLDAAAGRVNLDELSSGRELWRLLAIAALAFIGIEGLVAWRSVSGASTKT